MGNKTFSFGRTMSTKRLITGFDPLDETMTRPASSLRVTGSYGAREHLTQLTLRPEDAKYFGKQARAEFFDFFRQVRGGKGGTRHEKEWARERGHQA